MTNSAIAGPNKRVCAFLVDSLIINIVAVIISSLLAKDLVWILSVFGILLKDIAGGQSVGKRFVGTQIINANGQPVEPAMTVLRNITMVIPIFPLVEYIVMLRDKEGGRRLGDKLAKTQVADLNPAVEDKKYLWISLAIVAGSIAFQLIAASFLVAKNPALVP